MIASRFAVPLADLESTARVAVAEQVELQSEPRLRTPLVAIAVLPLAGGSGGDVDGDGA